MHFTVLPASPCAAKFYEIWHRSTHRRNHVCQVVTQSVQGLAGADPEISFGEATRRRGVWGGGVPLPRNFFQYCIIKWLVLVDSDVLHVLLIVVVKLETCT